MSRVLVDVGNTRVKLARLTPDDSVGPTTHLPVNDPDAWLAAIESQIAASGAGPIAWAISTVNPPASDRLIDSIRQEDRMTIRLFRSAAEVPVPHVLRTPATTGADRALAVLAAMRRHPEGGPGQVISCGTAITVEWISGVGIWQGGAIAPGFGPMSRALNRTTAQLPIVNASPSPPAAFGDSTDTALTAGIFWSVVGSIREILAQQAAEGLNQSSWRIWTGGDAATLAGLVEGEPAVVIPNLVLEGLAWASRSER